MTQWNGNGWGAPSPGGIGASGAAYQNTQAPTPGSQPMAPSLSPPGWSDFAQGGAWAQIPAYLPTLTLPFGPNVGVMLRRRTNTFASASANASIPITVSFDVPSTIFAVSAAAIDTTGTALPVGLNPLDTFRVQIIRTNGDRFDTNPGLGSAMCGTAAQPALIGPNGWMIDRGGAVQITVTTLRTNLAVDVTLWSAEVQGPFNFTWTNVPVAIR